MESLDTQLTRWLEAGLLDGSLVERIHAFESGRNPARGLRWPALLAIAFGALMVGGGLLLFVAAHWEAISPGSRFLLVLAQTAVLHGAGVILADRAKPLAMAFHGLGTTSLGAGIFLAGQIFHLQEHWPGGVMLWALGAWIGYGLLRDWVQGLLAALLTPLWLAGEWIVVMDSPSSGSGGDRVLTFGLLLLATTYFTLRKQESDGPLRRALTWVGGLALLPCVIADIVNAETWRRATAGPSPGVGLMAFAWWLALVLPLAVAFVGRRRGMWMNCVAALWVWMLGVMSYREVAVYAWCAVGAVGLAYWGVHEGRRERVNLGVAGFAITLVSFYFSSVMDKMGRSLGLMGLGFLFLLGGWQLERLRRRLNARILAGGAA